MEEKVQQIYKFIQERCLWQFHSRSWDREANINGILNYTSTFLNGGEVEASNNQEKCYLADAKILVEQLKETFSWINDVKDTEITELIDGVKAKLIDVTLTRSKNDELRVPFY